MESQRSLTDLPLEVLDLIYKYCRYLSHKVALAQTNWYLGQAFAHHSRNDFKIISNPSPIKLEDWCIILPLCGSNVNECSEIFYSSDEYKFKDLVALHCPNLEMIQLRFCMESVDSVISLISNTKDRLRSVDLSYTRDEEIQPKLVKEMPEMSSLRVLKLRNIHIEDVFQLQKFVNLEVLEFEIYQCIPTVNIFSICAPLTKLRSLSVLGVSIASEDTDLQTPLMALEELKLMNSDINMDFPTCPKLKSMTLEKNGISDTESSVRRSILNQGESLERLDFSHYKTPYDKQGFLELIRGCRKLKYLKLSIRNVKFTLNFVGEIVDILRKNGRRPNDPLELVVDRYYKFKRLQHWLTLIADSEILRPRLKNEIELN